MKPLFLLIAFFVVLSTSAFANTYTIVTTAPGSNTNTSSTGYNGGASSPKNKQNRRERHGSFAPISFLQTDVQFQVVD